MFSSQAYRPQKAKKARVDQDIERARLLPTENGPGEGGVEEEHKNEREAGDNGPGEGPGRENAFETTCSRKRGAPFENEVEGGIPFVDAEEPVLEGSC